MAMPLTTLRFDLSYALSTGKPPQFFMDPISWSPIFALDSGFSPGHDRAKEGQESSPESVFGPQDLDFLSDPKLRAVFNDLLQFTALLNVSSSSLDCHVPLLRDTDYQNLICSIQYRLLLLQGKLSAIMDESIRLAMLAFLTTTSQVAGQRARFPHLERRFREFCGAANNDGKPEVTLWLLVVGAMAVFDVVGEDEEWMTELWRTHIPPAWNWDVVHTKLLSCPWIRVLHDGPGQACFMALSRHAHNLEGNIVNEREYECRSSSAIPAEPMGEDGDIVWP